MHPGTCFSLWKWMLLLIFYFHEQLNQELCSCFFLLKSKQTCYWAKSVKMLLLPSSQTPLPVWIRYATLPTSWANFFMVCVSLSHRIYQLVYHCRYQHITSLVSCEVTSTDTNTDLACRCEIRYALTVIFKKKLHDRELSFEMPGRSQGIHGPGGSTKCHVRHVSAE